jgi:uncharacterized damage-inducible protein DinB
MRYDLDPGNAAGSVRKQAAAFVAALTETPASARAQRPDARTWSINGYAAHTADVALLLTERMRRILGEDRPQLHAYDEDGQARRGRFDEVPAQRSAMLVTERAAQAVTVLDELARDPDADRLWRRSGVHPEQGEIGLWLVVCDLVHELHHHADDVVAIAHRVDDMRS